LKTLDSDARCYENRSRRNLARTSTDWWWTDSPCEPPSGAQVVELRWRTRRPSRWR